MLRKPAGKEVASVGERFERGEVVRGTCSDQARAVTLRGIVEKVEEDGAGVVAEVRLTGTENDDLLRWSALPNMYIGMCCGRR